jgi:hypothetical protein
MANPQTTIHIVSVDNVKQMKGETGDVTIAIGH